MAAVQQQHDHDHQRKLVHKQFNSPMGLYSDQNVKETLDREIKAFGGSGIELDNQYIGKPSNLQNSAVLKMLEEEESERYTAKRNQITTERQSRPRNRCTVDRDTVLKINRRQPKRDYSWPPPNLICSRSRSSSDEQFNEEIRHKHNIDHIKEMFDKGIIFQHKNISTINKINLTKNSETLINRNTNKNNNNNNINIRSRSLNDNFHDNNNNNNNTNNNNELQSNTNYNLTETNLMKNDNTESLVKKKIFYLPENELYIGMVEPTCKYFEKLSKNSEYPLQYQKSPTTTNTNELLSDGSLTFTKKWKSTENFIDFQPSSYHNDNNSETRTKHDSSQQIFNSSSIILKSDNNNNFINKNIKIYTPGNITDTNTINKVTATNNTNLRTLSLDRQQHKKKYNSNSFNELPPLKPRGEYRKNLHSTTNNNKTKLNLNNTQNNKIMENKIPNKTTKVFNKNCINENEKFSNHQKSSKEICCNKNESIIQVKENIENSKNFNTKIRQATSDNNKMNDIKLKISENNYENCNDIIIKINNENFKSTPKQIQTKNIIKSSNNRISYSTEPTITIKDVGKTLLNFHEPSDNISNSSKYYTSTSSNKNNKKNINGMQKNIIICNISDADESTKRIQSAITPTTIQNENINNKNDNKIEEIKTKIRKTQEPPSQPSKSEYEIFETKLSDGQNEFYPSVNDDFWPNDITNFSYDNKIILGQGSQYKNYNLSDKFSKITSSTTSVTTTPDDDDQDRYNRGNNNTKNIRYSKNDSMSSISLTPTAKKSFSLTKQNDNQILTNSDNHNNCNNNNNKLVKQNSPLNLTQKDNFIGKTNDEENFPTSLSINLNENIKMKKKKLLYPPEMIITSDGINRIVNIINLNQNKDLQNSNNKLYNQLSSSSSLATRTTSSLSSLLSSPMYSKDFHLNDDKKPYREINIIPNITKKNNRICFFDSITQDDNKKNLDDENFIKSFLQQPKQENITLVVKTKNEIYENDKNDDNTTDDKNYSCLETNKIDTKPTTDKAINLTTKMVTTTDDTNNNVDNKTNATTLKQTTNTIIPSIKKIYYKPSTTTFTIDKNDEKRHGIYYTDGIDIWHENGKILSNNLKPIDLLNKENNDYKQVHLIDDKLNDLLLKKIQTDDEYNKYEKYNENQFKIELINKINDNNNNVIDKNKIISENLILNVIPIKNNINQIDIDNNELRDDENHLPISTITNISTSSLCGKYSKIQKSISEDLRRIDSYMESAEKSLYNIESSNDIYDETPLKKVMKHFMFNNNYNQQVIKNFNKDQIYDPLLINQTENMPVVENVLDDLYNMSLLLDSNNEINQYDNNENGNNKANSIELNNDIQLAEDQSKDDTTSVTETLSTYSEPSSTRTINFDKIIQSKNILSGYLITKQNQEELLEKASSVIHDNPSLIDYNNNINSNYLIDYNKNFQHNVDKIDVNIEGKSTSSPPSIKINVLQQGQQENFNDNINSLLKFNDKEKLSNSNNNENNITNKILKIDCNKMNQENINNKDNNVHHHQNHYKIMSPNKIADNVNFKIDKSLNLKYNVENDNKQIHHNHQQHEKNYNLHNEYPKLITTQNFQNNVINKDVTSIQCNERTIKRSSSNTKVEIYIENNNDNDDNDDDTNNNDKVNDNKSNKIGCAYKTPNNDNNKNIEIIIPTKSNQIELSSVAQLANNIKLVETNELTPSPTLSTYDNNILDKCDNIKSNTIMMTMMPSEINFNKQHNIQYYNHETKSRNSVAHDDDDIIVNSRCDDNNSYRHQTSGDNITNKIGINKNNYRIMNNVLVDVDDDGRCGIMKNSINGEYCDNDDGYNINTINTNNTCYDLLNNNTEEYNQELTNKILDDMEIYYYENNKNNKDYNNIDDDIYQKNHSNDPNNNSVVIESNFIKSSSMNRECNQLQLKFIDNTIDNIDDDIIKPKYQLRCTSQPPPIKHLVEISNDYIINFDSRNYYNLNRQHSYDSNINNCDNNQYLMSSPTLQLYPLEDGRYEWTNEGYKRVAWPPADQARTYRAYTPTPQPPNQQPNQDNNSLQSQPTQSQYPQQLQSGGQSQQQQQHQPQQQQPSQNPSSYQPINQGYQKPNYPGANQPSSQQGYQPQQSRPQPGHQPEQSRPQPGYQPQQSRPQQGYQPEQSRPQPGYQPEQSRPQPGYQPEQSRPQPGYQPQQSRPQQGYQPEQSRPQPGYQPEQSRPQPGYQPEQSRPQPGYQPEQSRPQPGYQPQKSHPDQGYVHPLNQQSQPHSPQMQQPNSNPYQQSGHVPYPHQDNNNMYPPYSYQTSSAPPSHMNGPSSTASFTGGVAQRPSAGLPQYNPQSKPFQSQYNVPSPSAQSYQQQPAQTGDDQQRGWTHVATPAPAARPGYTQSVYQPNTIGGGAGHATPQYGSQFGSNQNISGQQQPTNQAYHQSVPVSHNQPLSGQQFYQQPSQQQQNQMHPAQNQYHQQPSSFESQNNQYNQQQPQQQYNSQADQTNPGVITLRRETPTHQPPAPVIVSQPATKNFRGGSVMRGDLKWPPQDCRERMAADAEWEEQLSLGPACRPTKQQKDYSGFFAKHALSHNYPGYKIPPGTQHIEATY